MNILFSTVGRRGYLVNFFRESLGQNDSIYGSDSSPHAPGLAYCDHKIIFPKVTSHGYVERVINYCMQNRIDMVIPLIDSELHVLALAKEQFDKNNILLVVSPLKTVEIAYDKYSTYEFAAANQIPSPQSFLSMDSALAAVSSGTITWPLVVKNRKGSASINIFYCKDQAQLLRAFKQCPNPMIQEVLDGDEYGLDLFGGKDFTPISVFCKKKLAMRAGETDKAISSNDPALIEFGIKILDKLPIFGPCDVDIFMTKQGPKLLEINPRFGGGYPCSHLAGANFPQKLIDLRLDKQLAPDIGVCPAGVVMLKQDEIIRVDWLDHIHKA